MIINHSWAYMYRINYNSDVDARGKISKIKCPPGRNSIDIWLSPLGLIMFYSSLPEVSTATVALDHTFKKTIVGKMGKNKCSNLLTKL